MRCVGIPEAIWTGSIADLKIKDVKEMIGHSDISMTDRYSHLTLNHHKAIQDKLAKHYENTTN